MNEIAVPGAPTTAYTTFLGAQRSEPSAAACERWADEHAGDPEEARALVDAGWLTSRSDRGDAALALFRRAAACDGDSHLDAHIGIVDQLYALGRETEAEHAQDELRARLDAGPAGPT